MPRRAGARLAALTLRPRPVATSSGDGAYDDLVALPAGLARVAPLLRGATESRGELQELGGAGQRRIASDAVRGRQGGRIVGRAVARGRWIG